MNENPKDAKEQLSRAVGDTIIKTGLSGLCLILILGILWMAHEERLEEQRDSKELIMRMIEQCFRLQSNKISFDEVISLNELYAIDVELEMLDDAPDTKP